MSSCSTHQISYSAAPLPNNASAWQHAVACDTDISTRHRYFDADPLSAGLKRHRGGSHTQAGCFAPKDASYCPMPGHHGGQGKSASLSVTQQSHMLDNTLTAVMQSNLGSTSPQMEGSFLQDSYAPAGHTNTAQQQSLNASGDNLAGLTSEEAAAYAAAAAAAGDSNSMLYGKFKGHYEAYAEPHPHSLAAAADHPHNPLATDRAHQAHSLQHQQLFQQEQHRQQLQLQSQQAEAAAAAAAANAQHQQLLLAHSQRQAALARSAAAAAPQAIPGARSAHVDTLYGNYRTGLSHQQQQQPQQQWDTRAPASSVAYSHHGPFVPAQQHQQQHRPLVAGARLPPRPAGIQHHQQQQHGSSCAATAGGAWMEAHPMSLADYRAAAAAAASARLGQQQQQRQQDQHSHISSSTRAAGFPAAAPAAAGMGRWMGSVAVMEAPPVGSQDSDAGTGGLECTEDLLCMETGEGFQQFLQQQQQQQRRCGNADFDALDTRELHAELSDLIEGSGSTHSGSHGCPSEDMEDDEGDVVDLDAKALVASNAAALAVQQAAAAKQAVTLKVLGSVAAVRRGMPVLTATPAAAAAAGSASVRPRLLISEVSVYKERGVNSQMALDQANRLMQKMALPDDITYMPVSTDSFLFKAGAAWQFPAFVICLGSSYLQRMFVRLPQLANAALACPGFEDYCSYLPDQPPVLPPRLMGEEAVATLATLRSVQFTCLFLATKIADQVHALGLLRFMLTSLSHNGAVVSIAQAADVEARCLDALGWRLGPFFLEDELHGDDEELWAECMGHWDYGTHADTVPETF